MTLNLTNTEWGRTVSLLQCNRNWKIICKTIIAIPSILQDESEAFSKKYEISVV